MKKIIALILAVLMVFAMTACTKTPDNSNTDNTPDSNAPSVDTSKPAEEKKTAAFVTFGLGGDFFQALADTFVAKFKDIGWDASYADGEFNPTKQIEAAENYISMGVDTLFIWAVAPEAMGTIVADAHAKGITVIAFVAPIEGADAVMVSDEAELADDLDRLVAKWIDETFKDEPDHSVPVAAFTCRTAQTGVTQGDEMLRIEEFSKKAKLVIEVECADETQATGQEKMENLYTTNPEIKCFISPHNDLGMGINSYFTSMNSPVTDYSDLGIFVINGSEATADAIKQSTEGTSPLRGTVLTGSVDDTANEMVMVATGLADGSLPVGHVQQAGTTFVFADTIDEYLSTGTVKSVTSESFK